MDIKKYESVAIFLVIAACTIFSVQSSMAASTYVSLSVSHETVPSTIGPGDDGNILLTIENVGTEYARSAELTMRSHSSVSYSKNIYQVGTIAPSSSVQITIPVSINEDAGEGVAALSFVLKYFDGQSTTYSTMENFISLQITKRAIVQVKNVTYDKYPINPGSVVKMELKLENVGESKVNDLVASLDVEDLPLVQIEGDSAKYLGDVRTGAIKAAEFSLAVDKDAEIKAYSIPLTLTYYDESGVLHTDEKYVGMLVSGEVEFVIAIENTNLVYGNAMADITLSIANRGSAPAEALTALFGTSILDSTNGDGSITLKVVPEQYYIGTLDPDDFETVSLSVSVNGRATGKYDMPITLLYRDSYNTEYEVEDSVELELVPMPPIQIPLWMQLVAVAFVLFLLYWKRKFFMRVVLRRPEKK